MLTIPVRLLSRGNDCRSSPGRARATGRDVTRIINVRLAAFPSERIRRFSGCPTTTVVPCFSPTRGGFGGTRPATRVDESESAGRHRPRCTRARQCTAKRVAKSGVGRTRVRPPRWRKTKRIRDGVRTRNHCWSERSNNELFRGAYTREGGAAS